MFFGRRRGWLFPILLLALVLGTLFWWFQASRPMSSGEEATFIINKGETLDGVARKLEANGLVRNAFAFKLWMLINQKSGEIQAGSFRLNPGLSFIQLADKLATGFQDVWVTFPEGWRVEQYALRLQEEGFSIDQDLWYQLTAQMEGRLYPDTYLIPKDADEAWIVSLLINTFDEKTTSLDLASLKRSGLSWDQAIVVASLVEREVSQAADLPLVAGVIIGRWHENWALQIDATVQYALASSRCQTDWLDCDWWPNNLTRSDLRLVSPFNTYEQPGLPPRPICNPSLKTLGAVLDFVPTDYRYYLSDSQGVVHFAKTLDDHNANVSRYLRK